jgi:hypothetical protein
MMLRNAVPVTQHLSPDCREFLFYFSAPKGDITHALAKAIFGLLAAFPARVQKNNKFSWQGDITHALAKAIFGLLSAFPTRVQKKIINSVGQICAK